MPEYRYSEYHNPLVGSISDIMLRRGDIAAAGAQRQGDIAARSIEQRGAAWGQGIAQAGNLIAGAQQQQLDPQRQLATQQVDANKRSLAFQATATRIAQSLVGADGEPPDPDKVSVALTAAGIPVAMHGAILAPFESMQKNHKEAMADAGAVAYRVLKTLPADASDDDRGHAAAAALGAAMASGLVSPKDGKRLTDAIAQGADPYAIALGFMGASPSGRFKDTIQDETKPITLPPTPRGGTPARVITPGTGQTIATGGPANPAAPTPASLAATANDPSKTPEERAAAAATLNTLHGPENARLAIEKDREAREKAQGEERLKIARDKAARDKAIYDQTYGAGGTNPDGTAKAPVVSASAKAIAEYRQAPVSPRSAAAGPGKALMEQVYAYNPSYDAKQFPTRSKMMLAFTSGNQSQQLTALNTAIEHLGVLNDFAEALDNGSFKPGNELYNRVRTIFGSDAATNFTFARDVMAGELATAMKKSGATDTEIDKVTTSLSSSGSPGQLQGAIRKVAIPMIGGKASTLDQQYKAVMGEKDPFSVYTPGAKAVIEKFKAAGAQSSASALPQGQMRIEGPPGPDGRRPTAIGPIGPVPAGWRRIGG